MDDATSKPIATLTTPGDWATIFDSNDKSRVEAVLPKYVREQRWFAGKARTIQTVTILDAITVTGTTDLEMVRLVLFRIGYTEGRPDTYLLPMALAAGPRADKLRNEHPDAVIASYHPSDGDTPGIIYDATVESRFWSILLDSIANGRASPGRNGSVSAFRSEAFADLADGDDGSLSATVHSGQQSHTSAVFADQFVMKLFRRLESGENPDLEIGRFLTDVGADINVPEFLGGIEYDGRNAEPMTLAFLQQYQPNQGDAWVFTLGQLAEFLNRVAPRDAENELRRTRPKNLRALAEAAPPALAQDTIGSFLSSADLLGQRTAEMHIALASNPRDSEFCPELIASADQQHLSEAMSALAQESFQILRAELPRLPDLVQRQASRVIEREAIVLECFHDIARRSMTVTRIRCHGDYHLGQVLYTGSDFFIIDFEGEPDRPLSERRIKHSPLKDVAGMIRSFHYAANAALLENRPDAPEDSTGSEDAAAWVQFWYLHSAAAFLRGYLTVAAKSTILPPNADDFETLLNAYVLEKAMYELKYEFNNRPDWVRIPLESILQLSEPDA